MNEYSQALQPAPGCRRFHAEAPFTGSHHYSHILLSMATVTMYLQAKHAQLALVVAGDMASRLLGVRHAAPMLR